MTSRKQIHPFRMIVLAVLIFRAPLHAQFYSSDAYTEYNLLAPETHQFRIVYYVTELKVSSPFHVNGVRPGSIESGVEVFDPQTGKRLKADDMTGDQLIEEKVAGNYQPKEKYIRVHLPRPVPEKGEVRVRIDKTYLDPKSYYAEGDQIVYKRTLGIGRNSIVLPQGYALMSSNVAGQVIPLPDGRMKIAFANINGYSADVTIRARKTTAAVASTLEIVERAFDTMETLYDLMDPNTHRFKLVHDYTHYRIGDRSRLEILNAGPIEELEVLDLDYGEPLQFEKKGSAVFALLEHPVTSEKESARVRVTGKVQDPSYRMEHDELVWDRIFRGLRNTVVLPPGWELVALAAPALVGTQQDGRTTIHWVNPREEDMRVMFRARKRSGSTNQ